LTQKINLTLNQHANKFLNLLL